MENKKRFSSKRAIIFVIIAILLTILALILAINTFNLFRDDLIEGAMDILYWLIPLALALVAWILFAGEISKVTATDAELEEWKNEIQAKRPGFNNYLKQEDMKKFGSKLSFWLHSLHNSFAKVATSVALPLAIAAFAVSVVLPFAGMISSGGSSGFSYGIYVSDCSTCVVVTAYNFKSDKTYQRGAYDNETSKYTWDSKSYNYSLSGSTITISGGSFTVVSSTKLKDSNGTYWVKKA